MAAATPVVPTRLGGAVDFMIHEDTGPLVDERSPGQIADAVRRLVLGRGSWRTVHACESMPTSR